MSTNNAGEGERKRFFNDELDSSQENLPKVGCLNNSDSLLFSNEGVSSKNGPIDAKDTDFPQRLEQDELANIISSEKDSATGISIADLQKIIPEIPLNVAEDLCEKYSDQDDAISKAICHYFENPSSSPSISSPVSSRDSEVRASSSTPFSYYKFTSSGEKKKRDYGYRSVKRLKPSLRWKRFLGALQVNAMATRPTLRPLKYGSELKISKSSGNVSTSMLYNSTGGKKKAIASYVKIFDIQHGREIGRVPEDIAQILYPLLDRFEMSFEATMIFCGSRRLSIGDSFIIQLDCFLTSAMFNEGSTQLDLSRQSGNNPRKWQVNQAIVETEEELENRSRRMSFLALFDKLRIKHVDNAFSSENESKNGKSDDTEVIDLEDGEGLEKIIYQENKEKENDSSHSEDTMDLNQLKLFYRATQSLDSLRKLPEIEPSEDVFKLKLRRYQKQGLAWMLKREHEFNRLSTSQEVADLNDNMMNPLWKQFEWPKDMSWATQKLSGNRVDLNEDRYFYANLHTGEFSIEKPVLKTLIKGGILSDEMGLGKTISTLALILSAPHDSTIVDNQFYGTKDQDQGSSQEHSKPYASKTTLIVVPMSLLTQWSTEFNKANNSPDAHCEIYYGGNVSSLKTLLTRIKTPPTVILTTYGIVQNEWSKLIKDKKNHEVEVSTGLFSIDFYRVVLDEGHTIRNRMTATSKAVLQLSSKCRWVLTGTPIINRLDDLYSLVQFLKLEPWSQISYWKMFISDPFEKKDYKQAFDVVNAILEPVSLRRTKQMRDINGKLLVELPPKEIIVEKLRFNKSQEKIYKHYLDRAESSVKSGLAHGDLLKKYSTILVHILRLRQICCDVELLGSRDENDEDLSSGNQLVNESIDVACLMEKLETGTGAGKFEEGELKEVLSKIYKKYPTDDSFSIMECSICTTEPIDLQNALFLECGHSFCKNCLDEYLEFQKQKNLELRCPNCRELLNPNHLLKLEIADGKKPSLIPFDNNPKPAKIDALLKHLKLLQDTSAGEQVVIFSQFSSYLDVLERELSEAFSPDIAQIYKFDGRLNLKERANVLHSFAIKDFAKQKILLLSLKAGGVGLNLTCASYAFMMDPWWSPSMEDQAIDRIHRIGQTNNVKVVRFIIENSIEEKMLRIQDRKRTIGEAMDADEDERRRRRIQEIQMLFE